MQCQILSVWLRYTCVHKSRFYLPNNCTHTHTPPFHHGSPDILFGLCKKKKTDLFNTAKIHVSAYNPTYLWRTLDTHVMEITCHLQSAYRGNSVRFCAEIQPERACKSNKWQRVTCLSERIVGCWGGKRTGAHCQRTRMEILWQKMICMSVLECMPGLHCVY